MKTALFLILSEKKEILACVLVWDIRQPPVQIHSEVKEHPAYQDLGLGEILLEWAEKRARQAIPNCPQGTKVELLGGISNDYPRLKEIYTNSGFEWCRRELRMHIHFSEEQKAAELPENIQIRCFQKEKDSLAVYRADNEAFADHWGFVKAASEEEGYQQWQYFMEQDERFDPEYWLICPGRGENCWNLSEFSPDGIRCRDGLCGTSGSTA